MKQAIIFDLDGTLIDTPSGIVETFIAVLKSKNIAYDDHQAIRSTIGLPLEQAFSQILGVAQSNEQVPDAILKYQTLFKELVLPKAKKLVFKNVSESLTILKEQGYYLAIATSKVFKSAESLLKAAELWDFFDLVVGADHVSNPKPDPEMLHLILERLAVSFNDAIMVGDTTHDILMSNQARMRSIAVTYGVHNLQKLETAKPTWIIDSFDKILDCMENFSNRFAKFDEGILNNS